MAWGIGRNRESPVQRTESGRDAGSYEAPRIEPGCGPMALPSPAGNRHARDMVVRIVLGIFLFAHGVGHLAWMLAAFFPASQDGPVSDRVLTGLADSRSPAAKLIAVVGIGAGALFVTAAIGVFAASDGWFTPAVAGVVLSSLVAVSWWNPVGVVSVMALLANAGIVLAKLVPWVEDTAL